MPREKKKGNNQAPFFPRPGDLIYLALNFLLPRYGRGMLRCAARSAQRALNCTRYIASPMEELPVNSSIRIRCFPLSRSPGRTLRIPGTRKRNRVPHGVNRKKLPGRVLYWDSMTALFYLTSNKDNAKSKTKILSKTTPESTPSGPLVSP